MTTNGSAIDVNALRDALQKAFTENTDTVEALRPFQQQIKATGQDSDVEDIYDHHVCTSGLAPEILLRVRSDMGGGRDFRSEESLILGGENRLIDILQHKHIVFDETTLRAVMKLARTLYGGRVRKDGSLFYSHALKTALLFAEHGDVIRQDKVIVALLHDVIERGMANADIVHKGLVELGIGDADRVTSLVAAVAPTRDERAAIKAGDVSTYFGRMVRSGLLAIILAEKLQNINDGRCLFLARPADERGYITTRLKPAVIRQYLEAGQATEMKMALLADYLDLLYLTETYDETLDSCVAAFLNSDNVSSNVEVAGLSIKLDRLKAFQGHNAELSGILDKYNLNRDSANYAHLRKAVTDAALLLSTGEMKAVFAKGNEGKSAVQIAVDRFMERFKHEDSLDVRRAIDSEHCAVLLDIIGYEIIEKAVQSQKLVEGEEEVAQFLGAVPRENGVAEVHKAPGELIVRAGEVGKAVYLLLEGYAYVSFPSDRGRREFKIGPGNTISSTSVRKGRVVAATVTASESGVRLLMIPKGVYLSLCESPRLLALLEKTSDLRRVARLRSEKAPIANLDLVQCNTLRQIIDVQDGWTDGTFDAQGNRKRRRVVFRSSTSTRDTHLSFAQVSALVTGFEAEHLDSQPKQRRFLEEAGVESLSLLSKLRGLMIEGKIIIEIDGQSLSEADLGDKKKPAKFMRKLEEMLTVETAKGREHRQAIDLTLYSNFERHRRLKPPASLIEEGPGKGQDLIPAVLGAAHGFIDEAIDQGFLYARNDPDDATIKQFVTDLVGAIANNHSENIIKHPESFKKVVFSTLESLIVQQGGALFRDEDAYWSFGTGANRLRGSNGIMHVIANWRRGKAILGALQSSYPKLAEYQAIFCFAAAWHDANAGSIQEANTGSRFWATGQSPDLKAGHGFAAVKYLDELRKDLNNIFGESRVCLIERLIARHDNGQLRFDTDEEVLFSVAGISDNSASEEKTIDAFTKVPGNERVAVELFDLFRRKGKDTTADDADEAMTPLRRQMEANIAEAARNKLITTIQSNAYLNAIKADLTLFVGKLALESLGMHQSVSRVEFADGVLTIHHTRSPLYADLKAYLGEGLLQARICDSVKEYEEHLPGLDLHSDLAAQNLVHQVPDAAEGQIREVVFKVEDADPGTKPNDYTARVYEVLREREAG